jgi:sulfur transfer protein SufE
MFKEKIKEYKSTIETLESMDPLEIYSYLMQKGQDLNKDALSQRRHIQENKVTQCMYDLYVDKEDERFKAWSDATIAAGYAFILVDIFNTMTSEEAKTVTVKDFKEIELDKKLTMSRQTVYFQAVTVRVCYK